LLGGNEDYDYVVKERIQDLSLRLYKAGERLKEMSPSKAKLADELASVKLELSKKSQLLDNLRRLLEKNV